MRETPASLLAQASLYAGGDLPLALAAAFERRLGTDQAARDALCAAVCRAGEAEGAPPPTPDPAYRQAVRRRLLARRGRTRGAVLWAGAAAAVLLLTLGLADLAGPPALNLRPPADGAAVALAPRRGLGSHTASPAETAARWAEHHPDDSRCRHRAEHHYRAGHHGACRPS